MTTADLLFGLLLIAVAAGVFAWRRRDLDVRRRAVLAVALTEGWRTDPTVDAELERRLESFDTLPRHGRRRTAVQVPAVGGDERAITLFDHDVVTGPEGQRRRHQRTFALVSVDGAEPEARLPTSRSSGAGHGTAIAVPDGRHELHLPDGHAGGRRDDARAFLELLPAGLVVEVVDGQLLVHRDGGLVATSSLGTFAREARELARRLA